MTSTSVLGPFPAKFLASTEQLYLVSGRNPLIWFTPGVESIPTTGCRMRVEVEGEALQVST